MGKILQEHVKNDKNTLLEWVFKIQGSFVQFSLLGVREQWGNSNLTWDIFLIVHLFLLYNETMWGIFMSRQLQNYFDDQDFMNLIDAHVCKYCMSLELQLLPSGELLLLCVVILFWWPCIAVAAGWMCGSWCHRSAGTRWSSLTVLVSSRLWRRTYVNTGNWEIPEKCGIFRITSLIFFLTWGCDVKTIFIVNSSIGFARTARIKC